LSKHMCRPKRGYPKPPPTRDESYPTGGLWRAPRGGVCIRHVRAEHSRLAAYFTAIKDSEEQGTCCRGESEDLLAERLPGPCDCKLCRLHRMAGHLRWLDHKIAYMCSR
jgi:hypothetical protein